MKNLFKNSIIAILLVVIIAITVVGCDIGAEDTTPHTHQYTEETTKAPSCTEKGEKTFTCTCGDSYTEEIPAKEHADADKDHVCDNECGVAQGTHAEQATSHTCEYCGQPAGTCKDADNDHDCDVCGAEQGTHAEQATSHTCEYCGKAAGECRDADTNHECDVCGAEQGTHAEQATSHTCEYCGKAAGTCRDGDTNHECDVCGAEQGTHAEQATSHTCEYCGKAAGECRDTDNDHDCDVCGAELSQCQAGSPVKEKINAAGCGTPGSYDEVTYCTVCGDELNRTTITTEALPHNYSETITKEATCEEAGSKTLNCSACGDTKTEEIAALGHKLTSYEAKAPTCTAIGWDAYVKCSRCDYTTYNELPKASHNYNEEVTAPTCTEGGYTTYTCTGCGKYYTGNATDATGHQESAVVTSPDCENGGYTTYTCSACGETRIGEETEKLGHDYEESVQDATCTEPGLKTFTCKNDPTHKYTEVIPAKEHDYEVTVKDATCTEAGLKTFDCKNCDDVYTEEIPASGSHSFTDSFVCDNCEFDSTEFRLENGGFENGLDGWKVVGNIGGTSSEKTYWNEGIEFGMDGDKMFSAYAPGALESAVGTLTSSTFKVGGSGWITFKVGAMRDENYVYVDVVDAETKQILARYYNGLWSDADLGGCKLVAYKADLSAFMGKEVFFRISDNADSGYGLFFVDSFVTYYQAEPEGFNAATPVSYAVSGTIYDVFNGGFEMGGDQGWWNHQGQPGAVTGANAFFNGREYGKDGDFLYSGVEDYEGRNGREGNRGLFTSSVFEIGGSGWISFKLGGGNDICYVQVIDAVTGEILVRYRQEHLDEGVLQQYVADLSAFIGRTVRIQIADYAVNNWGCVSFDNVVTYYASTDELPTGYTPTNILKETKYNIINGSFEDGNLNGWIMNITESAEHNTLGWVQNSERGEGWYNTNDDRKDGSYLFTFYNTDGRNCEWTMGTLTSSTFALKQNAYVSFRFGAAGSRDVYIQLCKADGTVIATFYNEAEGKTNTEMYAYYYQYTGEETDCFIRVVDNSQGGYGCLVIDDFRVNLESAPEGFIPAIQ